MLNVIRIGHLLYLVHIRTNDQIPSISNMALPAAELHCRLRKFSGQPPPPRARTVTHARFQLLRVDLKKTESGAI